MKLIPLKPVLENNPINQLKYAYYFIQDYGVAKEMTLMLTTSLIGGGSIHNFFKVNGIPINVQCTIVVDFNTTPTSTKSVECTVKVDKF